MDQTWTEKPLHLAGAIEHTLRVGDEPTDEWRISVALPPPALAPVVGRGPYPALYLFDGYLTFVAAAQIAQWTAAFSLGQLQPIVVVGISPATDDLSRLSTQRNRDLTPTGVVPPHLRASTPYGTGGAAGMLDLLERVIVPHLEATYPLDRADRGLGGHSLGGLFACWALLTRPAGFRRYLAVSPALYWDDRLLLDEQRLPAADRSPRDVYLACGEREGDHPEQSWPTMPPEALAAFTGINVTADVLAFAERLRRLPGMAVRADIVPDEQHATVWWTAFTRGLIHLYRTDRQP